VADLIEEHLAGSPGRATAPFTERESPFVAMDDPVLRVELVHQALRLAGATETLGGGDGAVAFSNQVLGAEDISLHGRSEAALHRWDLVGDDDVGDELLGRAELTAHATTVLNEMLVGSSEAVRSRARRAGPLRAVLRSPGCPDVVLVVDDGAGRFDVAEPQADLPALETDGSDRLLLMWGRRSQGRHRTWDADDATRRDLVTFLGFEP
jgi:hypothetical protein